VTRVNRVNDDVSADDLALTVGLIRNKTSLPWTSVCWASATQPLLLVNRGMGEAQGAVAPCCPSAREPAPEGCLAGEVAIGEFSLRNALPGAVLVRVSQRPLDWVHPARVNHVVERASSRL
jgi:hypothetical protein